MSKKLNKNQNDSEFYINERENSSYFIVLLFMSMIFIGNPLLVLSLYLMFGWKVAVLSFPVILKFEYVYLAPQVSKRSKLTEFKGFIVRLAKWAILIAVPSFAVISDHIDFMRIWAILVAAIFLSLHNVTDSIFSSLSFKKRRLVVRAAIIASSVLFVCISELIWYLAPLWLWLIFHASLFIVYTVLVMAIISIIGKLLGGGKMFHSLEFIDKSAPRKSKLDNSTPAKVQIVADDKTVEDYKEIRNKQTLEIFRRYEWPEKAPNAPTNRFENFAKPYLTIEFGFSESVTIQPSGDNTCRCSIRYSTQSNNWKLGPMSHNFQSENVPLDLVEQIFDLAWVYEFEELSRILQPYKIKTNHFK